MVGVAWRAHHHGFVHSGQPARRLMNVIGTRDTAVLFDFLCSPSNDARHYFVVRSVFQQNHHGSGNNKHPQ
jgi:hypothetical protein